MLLDTGYSFYYTSNIDLRLWHAIETESGTVWVKFGQPFDLCNNP